MAITVTSMSQLKAELSKRMNKAMNETKSLSEQTTRTELQSFYSQGDPDIYRRTGKLGNSMRSATTAQGLEIASFTIYLDTHYGYDMPNEEFIKRGFKSYFTTPMVFDNAEAGTAHIKGKPGFWARSRDHIQKNLTSTFSKYFN